MVTQMTLTPEQWERTVAHWLPDVWTPGKLNTFGLMTDPPPITRDIAMRVLEAMLAKGYVATLWDDFVRVTDRYHGEIIYECQYDGDLMDAIALAAYELAQEGK